MMNRKSSIGPRGMICADLMTKVVPSLENFKTFVMLSQQSNGEILERVSHYGRNSLWLNTAKECTL